MNAVKEPKLIKQGAEAKIYLAKYDSDDKQVIVKERFPKKYRQEDLDKALTKKRTKHEEKLLKKAFGLGLIINFTSKI